MEPFGCEKHALVVGGCRSGSIRDRVFEERVGRLVVWNNWVTLGLIWGSLPFFPSSIGFLWLFGWTA